MKLPVLLIGLVIAAIVAPHPFNVTPIGALGLFAGAYARPRLAWAVPVMAMLGSQLIVGFYEPIVTLGVYLGLLGGPLVGRLVLTEGSRLSRLAPATVVAALLFFLTSNFGNWAANMGVYTLNFAGLLECYWNGLPFLGRSVLGDLAYSALLFGSWELLQRGSLSTSSAKVA